MTSPQQHAHLLSLPGELRNKIYRLVLDSSTHSPLATRTQCIHHMRHPCNDVPTFSFRLAHTPLSWPNVCRQIRSELLSIYYSETTFSFHSQNVLFRWLRSLTPELRRLIRTIKDQYPRTDECDAGMYLYRMNCELQRDGLGLQQGVLMVCYWNEGLENGWRWTRDGLEAESKVDLGSQSVPLEIAM